MVSLDSKPHGYGLESLGGGLERGLKEGGSRANSAFGDTKAMTEEEMM